MAEWMKSGVLTEQPELQRPPLRLFFGSDGLRAGWGIALFLLLHLVLWFGAELRDEVPRLRHPIAAVLPGPLFTAPGLVTEAIAGMVAVVACAILLARPRQFGWAKGMAVLVCMGIAVFGFVVANIYLNHVLAPHAAGPKPANVIDPFPRLVGEALACAVVMLASWIMARIERRPFGSYGLGGTRRLAHFGHGLAVGFAAITVLIAGLWLGHWIVFAGLGFNSAAQALKDSLGWTLLMVAVGLFEELLNRGYLQFTLARGFGSGGRGFWLAALATSLFFGLGHLGNSVESPMGILNAGLTGPIFCLSLWYTRSLWWAIGMHASWDWGQSFFYGTADSGQLPISSLLRSHPQGPAVMSGGGTGPEGSVLCTVVLAALCFYAWATLRRERVTGVHAEEQPGTLDR